MPLPALKGIPTDILKKLDEKLINGESSRTVSAWLETQGHKFSFKAVNRYNNAVIKPALKIGLQLQAQQAVARQSESSIVEQSKDVKSVTKQVLSASPILQRINAKFGRLDTALNDVVQAKEYDLLAKLEAQESKAIELLGKATGDPNFVPGLQQTNNTTINVAVMLPPAETHGEPQAAGAVIDADSWEVKR